MPRPGKRVTPTKGGGTANKAIGRLTNGNKGRKPYARPKKGSGKMAGSIKGI